MRFVSAMNVVSSTNAVGPSASSSLADSSSVTVGGECVIASAYSMTSRSNGVKTSDSRHRGTSRARSRRVPRCALGSSRGPGKAAVDQAGHRHVGRRLQILVTLIPLLYLTTEAEAEVQHLPVVPRHLDRLGTSPSILRDIRLTIAP